MGTRFRNEAQVRRYLLSQDKLIEVVNYILDKIYETNQNVIDKIVYSAYNPTQYERTNEFKDAWGTTGAKASGIHIKGYFEYEPNNMIYDATKAQHGSPDWYNGTLSGDARAYLADIIYEGLAGDLFGHGPWTAKRDAWNVLLKEINSYKIAQWVVEGFQNIGLRVNFNTTAGMDVK